MINRCSLIINLNIVAIIVLVIFGMADSKETTSSRNHVWTKDGMENTLRKKQAEELNDLNKVHLQEREALKKSSQNGINNINSQLTGSKLSLEKAKKNMKRKVLEEEEDLVPECPVCMVEMLPPKQIFQCLEGHLVCSECKPSIKNTL